MNSGSWVVLPDMGFTGFTAQFGLVSVDLIEEVSRVPSSLIHRTEGTQPKGLRGCHSGFWPHGGNVARLLGSTSSQGRLGGYWACKGSFRHFPVTLNAVRPVPVPGGA
jgi:hypothetical protein